MGVIRNNVIGELSVSSASTVREWRVNTSTMGDVFTSDALYVQGMKNIALQVADVNQITFEVEASISQEGALPQFFKVAQFFLNTGGGTNFLYFNYVIPCQFVRVYAFIGSGTPEVLYRVRLMASQ